MRKFLEFYRNNNLNVIPLRANEKVASIAWRNYQENMSTAEEHARWFAQDDTSPTHLNVGIVTGSISGVIVLDVDGPRGEASLADHDPLPHTPCVRTARGRHYYFRYPEGRTIRNFAGKLPGIDLRSDGGYVVAPPSVHPGGTIYQWVVPFDRQSLAPLPEWLLDISEFKSPEQQAESIDRENSPNRRDRRTVEGVIGTVFMADEGSRNDTLYRASVELGRMVALSRFDREWARQKLLVAAIAVGLPQAEAVATIESGMSTSLDRINAPTDPEWVLMEETPETLDRPLRLIDGKAYCATWVPMERIDGDENAAAELVVISSGALYCNRSIQGALPLARFGVPPVLWTVKGLRAPVSFGRSFHS